MTPDRVIEDWTWQPYDDHGPWDEQLGEVLPTHGWRRQVAVQLGHSELLVTEWHFGLVRPDLLPKQVQVRELHAVRPEAFDDAA